jgi:DNA-binding NarL/FixJ family response regulator
MNPEMMKNVRLQVAIVDTNTLAAMGLRQMLQTVMPIMEVDVFSSLDELQQEGMENYFHYFVAMSIVLENRQFFLTYRRQTIVLTITTDPNAQLSDFHCLCVQVPEDELVRKLLQMVKNAHGGGRNLPPMPRMPQAKVLSDREIEVLSLIVQGYLNKEIANLLHISITTVITHRKNIMEKLDMKSVSSLTIYAVMNGYVDISKI